MIKKKLQFSIDNLYTITSKIEIMLIDYRYNYNVKIKKTKARLLKKFRNRLFLRDLIAIVSLVTLDIIVN